MNFGDLFCRLKERQVCIAVIGDIMLDEYEYGHVTRVSPEFPVPILRSHNKSPEYCPGGASNVGYQLENFNCLTYLFGFIDSNFSRLSRHNFNIDGCVRLSEGGFIPRKIRFYDDQFPLLRWDIEADNYGLTDLSNKRQQLFDNFMAKLPEVQVVILSNYDKGLFNKSFAQQIIHECKLRNVITIVDPKSDCDKWIGCDVFKPNATEASKLTPPDEETISYLKKKIGCKSVVITKAGEGVFGEDNGNVFIHRPKTKEVNVNSVIGAGDCYTAVLALLLAHNLSVEQAALYAFEAGSEYVKAKHNRPIYPHELHKRLEPIESKIIEVNDLAFLSRTCYANRKFIFTNGVYDLLHTAHLDLLNYAKSLGDKLIVALNTDESVKRLKGESRPINTLTDRMRVLASLDCIDFIVSFAEDTPFEVINTIKPHKIVKGGDYNKEAVIGVDIVGVDNVHLFPYRTGSSTTSIIQKIKNDIRPIQHVHETTSKSST